MYTDTDPQRDAGQMLQLKGPDKWEDVQRHVGDVHCMPVAISFRQTWCNHVGIADSLNLRDSEWFISPFESKLKFNLYRTPCCAYLIDIMVVEDAVEGLVDVVEHVHHLHGSAVVAEGGEANDVAEVDGDLLEQLWLHSARLLQWTHHRADSKQRS